MKIKAILKKIKYNFFLTSFLNIGIFLLSPITLLSSLWLKFFKLSGVKGISDSIFMSLGILPVLDQYYQPLINPKKHLKKSLNGLFSLQVYL
jgi:hypothetical protein